MLLAANSIDSSIGQQHQNHLNLPTDSPDEPYFVGKSVASNSSTLIGDLAFSMDIANPAFSSYFGVTDSVITDA